MYIKSLLLTLVLLLPSAGVYGVTEFQTSFLITSFLLLISFLIKFSILIFVFLAICSFLQLGYTLYSGKIIDDFYWIAYFSANKNEARSFFEALSSLEITLYIFYIFLLFLAIFFGYFSEKYNGKYSRPLTFDGVVIGCSLISLLLTVSLGDSEKK